ncbi:MAG TPA: DNA gyrase inhibitor YacG [Agitococcus sp.]|mgnify:FL=1|nr:DNA gyrase inhibitor YacG [Agitococcus sp.]HMY81437.1 DNA gyrase inhibitor YacG [Agitococcus sp.]HNA20119.1 DNA gyrase inhibitor YacG [Agitococcus sp.]HNC85421.1 DNA gyrase inhibitor YacG [Agitococcus sp.]HNG09741.1 DNA gyrase inhibitor YacG [Agitococcus sp.]
MSTTPSTPLMLACRQCQKMTTWHDNPHRPFCSERCKLIDLGAWASESYSIPVESMPLSEHDHE